jgi:hypothetical protein
MDYTMNSVVSSPKKAGQLNCPVFIFLSHSQEKFYSHKVTKPQSLKDFPFLTLSLGLFVVICFWITWRNFFLKNTPPTQPFQGEAHLIKNNTKEGHLNRSEGWFHRSN